MNRKILVIFVALMAATMLATPVMAKSPNKLPATAAITAITGYDPTTIEIRVTDDGILHLEFFKMWGTIDLSLDGGPAIPVEWVDICVGTYNPRSNTGIYRFDEVWTLPDGTFVGTDHVNMEGNLLGEYTGMHTHIVLQGVGFYEGQVLNLKMDTEEGAIFTGSWLKP